MTPPTDPTVPGAPGLPDDDAIPMLTEVIEVNRPAVQDRPPPIAEADWTALARQVQDEVLDQLLRRSDALFEDALRPTLDAIVGRATAQLQADLQTALAQLTREVVARALAEELARLHAEAGQRGAADGAPI
jgi:hypothetical protein